MHSESLKTEVLNGQDQAATLRARALEFKPIVPILTLIGGPQGTGKTSLAENLIHRAKKLDPSIWIAEETDGLISNRLILITTPEDQSLVGCYTKIKSVLENPARSNGHNDFCVIVNRARSREEGRRVFDRLDRAVEKHLGLRLTPLGAVPEDPFMALSLKKQSLLVSCYPSSPASLAVHGLAERLLNHLQKTGMEEDVWR